MSTGHHATSEDAVYEVGINVRKMVAVGVGTLALIAASVVFAWVLLDRDVGARSKAEGLAVRGSEIGKAEIGIVDQVEFEADTRLETWKEEQRVRLTGYGWVDRAKGLIHIPIDIAMKQVVEQAGQGGSR